jgi:hypothetical protein
MNDVMKLLPHSTKDAKVTPWPINPQPSNERGTPRGNFLNPAEGEIS